MLKSQGARITAVSIAILLFVLLLVIPRTPSVSSDGVAPSESVRSLDDNVQEAIDLMESENPMTGIMQLREILEKDPENIDASWALGTASMRTGQFDKAVSRFEHVITHDHEGRFLEAHLFLGNAQEELGNADEAIKNYHRFLESESEPQLMQQVRERIAVLEKKS